MSPDGLKRTHRQMIIDTLAKNEKVQRIILFGSRAMGTFTPNSDIDLALCGPNLTLEDQASLQQAVEELTVPQKVDIVLYDSIDNQQLVDHIKQHGVLWWCRLGEDERKSKLRDRWFYTTLGDFCPFKYGKGLPEKKRDMGGNINVYGSNGIVGKNNIPFVKEPGIIVGRKGTVGLVHYSSEPFWPIDTTFYITKQEGMNLRYTYYLLQSCNLTNMNGDSAVPGLNRNAAHRKRIKVPPYNEQRAIAHILGSLDDKIELNRQMNQTLEQMAQALFKSWFTDFDPVVYNAVQAGHTVPECFQKRAEYYRNHPEVMQLPADVLALFPDQFEQSELGWIPVGWQVGKIADLGKVICGKTPSTKCVKYYGDDVPFITIPDMHQRVFVTTTNKNLSKQGAETQMTKFLPKNTICVSCIATPGLVAMTTKKSQTNQQINSIIPQKKSPYFVFNLLERLGEQIRAAGSGGSVFSNLNKARFKSMKITYARDSVDKTFHQYVKSIYDYILQNEHNILKLAEVRDSLLPKLISGDLDLKNKEVK